MNTTNISAGTIGYPPKVAGWFKTAALVLAFLSGGFNALAQSSAAPAIVYPSAVPTAIPVASPTNVWFRAKLILPPGGTAPASLSLMVKQASGDAVAGSLSADPSGSNVYSLRSMLNVTSAGPRDMYLQTTLPGIVSGPLNSAVFTINVYGSPTVTHAVDPSILTGPPDLPDLGFGTRPVAAVKDAAGITSRFIANEVIFSGSAADTNAFIAKYGGNVVARISGANLPAVQATALIILDPSSFSTQNLDSDTAKMGGRGQSTYSSDQAARLAALAASEAGAGHRVALNFISESQDYLWSTQEEADPSGIANAFAWPEFDRRAWEFVAANGFKSRVKLAVIDGGFWLDSEGHPFTDASGKSDLPHNPVQWNPFTYGATVGGPNPDTCTGGTTCRWHGNSSVSVALGALNNSAGAAGTGGLVADPILLLFDGSDFAVESDVVQALAYGANIISMSFEGHCNWFCRTGHWSGSMDGILNAALDSGVLMVAAAGNDSSDVNEVNSWPCTYSSDNNIGVYCVGALGSNNDGYGFFQSYTHDIASYSNYGIPGVSIWAPSNIHAMPNGDSGGELVVHGGTSAATPYVAGIAAMIKALDPSLDGEHIKAIIGNGPYIAGTSGYDAYFPNTPWSSNVDLVIEPYPAVVQAAGGYHLKPDLSITAPKNNADYDPYLTSIAFSAAAQDVNDGVLDAQVVWTSDVDGLMGSGKSLNYDFSSRSEGLRHITATATNIHGIAATATIAITIKFAHLKPTPVILWPKDGMTINPGTYTVTGWANLTNPGIDLSNVPCDQLVWNGSIKSTPLAGTLGECQAPLTFAAGTQKVTLSASNRLGDKGTTTISVNVKSTSDMTVAITDPPDNFTQVVTVGGASAISLAGDAAPLLPAPATVQWSWYWYYVGSSPSTQQLIGSTSSSKGSSLSWVPERSGLCADASTANVILVLQVANSTTSPKAVTTTGSTTSDLQIQCVPSPK